MTRIKIPTQNELLRLSEVQSDICVSIYVETSPLKQDSEYCRIELHNQVAEAYKILHEKGYNKRRVAKLKELLDSITHDDEFCKSQLHSLALLATPDNVQIYRLANKVENFMEISDRFYLKPLFRALTFPHTGYILALSENQIKVIELHPDSDPQEIKLENMPKNASSALGLRSMTSSLSEVTHGSDGRKSRLTQYARIVNDAMSPVTNTCDHPLILIAAEPLASIYRQVSSSCILKDTLHANPEHMNIPDLVALGRPALDNYYEKELSELRDEFAEKKGENLVLTDMSSIAKAATYGMVATILVDFDYAITGFMDDEGNITLSEEPEAYGLIDEIIKRSLQNGARIVAVRQGDMVGDTGVAAILRYSLTQSKSA